jgi:hypothetical protein
MYALHVSAFGHLQVLFPCILFYIQLYKILCCYKVYIINYKIIKVVQLDLSKC